MWTVIFSVSGAILSTVCALAAVLSARGAFHEQESLRRRLRSCESQLSSFADSLKDTQTTMEALANRVKMQRVRNATEHVKGSSDEPDPYKDPDGWRKMMNSKLQKAKFGI